MENEIAAILKKYQLTDLIDPQQVQLTTTEPMGDYALIQAIFNNQIEAAAAQQDWDHNIALLQAMVHVSQQADKLDDTIIAEISWLYLTFCRYYNTPMMQAQTDPILKQLRLTLQQAQTTYEQLDGFITTVIDNLAVPNTLPRYMDPEHALSHLIQKSIDATEEATSSEVDPSKAPQPEAIQQLGTATLPGDATPETANEATSRRSKETPGYQPGAASRFDTEEPAPFYKKWWFWTLIVLIVLIIIVVVKLFVSNVTSNTASSTNNDAKTEQVSKSSAKHKATTTSKKKQKSPSASAKALTFQDFNSINIDDLSALAPAGTTYQSLRTQFGEPTQQQASTKDGQRLKTITWRNIKGQPKAAIIVSFIKNRAYEKKLTGYQTNQVPITLAVYDDFKIGLMPIPF
ncbi:hypothetical protein JCM14202_3585 [Agrilactobacillus composti DSM 18527 = JCM 14202]|uniref:hypothetical protein n=1 Tax=Agrilactobacillus composti TaxID=398555 RepID=UPI00042E1157|nr:hypothetical protein [Agrilactobacillus composti]GAF41630.1 hypothetical protein JCM14202_3585 [Agrilactobacillus composti DSM 18527 = JCM 14202]